MFKKLLIANRGEIACRIIRTARKLNIHCIALYSEADKNALHVKMADEAVLIGPAPAKESYLNIAKIIDVAKQTGADAIHPGYGFLSENAAFARACEENNITFIGPSSKAIRAMGSKMLAKKIMQKANIPLLAGYFNQKQLLTAYKKAAQKIGYPVLLKASAGGGGKGMRIINNEEEFFSAWNSAKREALVSFGNDEMILEKFLPDCRHVEVQILGDHSGSYVSLFERDCSVQRRQQKIIEEAPAPNISENLRNKLAEVGIAAAKAINYSNAGTIEFLLDTNNHFYFMEMNTRIQVEHPVTEMITGIDIVEWQLRIAAGEKIPIAQKNIVKNGHAFEARIYAEDSENNFLPVTGKITQFKMPETNNTIRIDSGVQEKDEISIYYDSLLAKLIIWDKDRSKALKKLNQALNKCSIEGIKTNIEVLKKITLNPYFQNAVLSTSIVKNLNNNNFINDEDIYSPWNTNQNWRLGSEIVKQASSRKVLATKKKHSITKPLIAPMPGRVTVLLVKPGQKVKQGENLIAIEAMKMEHIITAPGDGVVEAVFCQTGEIVQEGKELLKINNS